VASRSGFGWARKLPSGRYQASFIGSDGRRFVAPDTFSTKTDAQNWLAVQRARVLDGTWREPDVEAQRFGEFAELWIAERPGLRPKTIDTYTYIYNTHMAPYLADHELKRMTPTHVRRWRKRLTDAGVSDPGRAKAYRLLRAMMNTAVEEELIDRSPCRIRGAGVYEPPERPTLDVEQVGQLLDMMPPRYVTLIALTTFASLRWGEVIALRRRDVDLEAGTLSIRGVFITRTSGLMEPGPPKSRAGTRRIALPRPVVTMLTDHMDHFTGAGEDALIFTNRVGGPLRRSNFNRAVKWPQAREALGVPNLHIHDLRHTGNTLAAATPGTSIRDLMERMGHDSMRAAVIYQHATRQADLRIAESLTVAMESIGLTSTTQPPDRDTARGQHGQISDDGAGPGNASKSPKTLGSKAQVVVPSAGFEPATHGLGNRCSIP
jgi:integrase